MREGSASLLCRGETEALGKFLLSEPLCEIQAKSFLPQPLQLSGAIRGKAGRVISTPSPGPPSQIWRKQEGFRPDVGVLRPHESPGGGGGHVGSSVIESQL